MNGFVKTRFEIGETAVTVAAHRRYVGAAVDGILRAREEIRRQISADGFFLTTFEPYELRRPASAVVECMCEASRAADVGPMATVAGAIADAATDSMTREGCGHCWVDNGGDIALSLSSPVTVDIFTGPEHGARFGLEVGPDDGIGGICSSSGTMGHSISLGGCDVCTVLADSAPLADAYATAIGNGVRDRRDIDSCFDPFRASAGFIGGIVVSGGEVAVCGAVPDIVEVEHDHCGITAHSRMSSGRFLGDDLHVSARRGVIR
ncbi:MAG: UPF0280 family protein [Methanobacteriota archaeon]|nr:MAG: UPF0280 family protein [Euryarchaeota archaeon]